MRSERLEGEPLARHTSLKVGGPADLFQVAATPEQAVAALQAATAAGMPLTVLGGGSNLLPADEGVEGLVLRYVGAQYAIMPAGDEVVLVAEAGCSLAGLARRVAKQGWAGLEWAVNIPGTVGGAVVNNAGAFGSCMAESVRAVEVVDLRGRRARLFPAELGYEYRSSRLKRRELGPVVVLSVELRLRRADVLALGQKVAHNQQLRTQTQPRQLSAGSVFANPGGDYAGRLIELAGLKGLRRGGAQISPQHANFVVSLGGARARDVYALMCAAQEAVWATSCVWLLPEIELIGRWSGQELGALEASLAPLGAGHG